MQLFLYVSLLTLIIVFCIYSFLYLQVICVITLIVFSLLLHNMDDGFSISKELRLSIALTLGSWGIFFAVLYSAKDVFNQGILRKKISGAG